MEKNLSKPWGPHHKGTWGPSITPAHLRTWLTLFLYPDAREGLLGVLSQQPSEARKCVQLMWSMPISQGQPMVPWTVRPKYGPSSLSASKDPDVTALSGAVRKKLGILEPLPKPALASPSPGLSTLPDAVKRSRVSRLLLKVTCPSPFHTRARTVPIAELHNVPVTETEKKGLTALALLTGRPTPPSYRTAGGRKSCKPIAQANIQLELPEFDPKNRPERAADFADFLLLTGQSHVDVGTKGSRLKRSCKFFFLAKTGETDYKNLF